jgi:hypothetical protein
MAISTRAQPAGPRAQDARGSSGGIGRKTSAAAEKVSNDLRRGSGGFLQRRRKAFGLSMAAAGSLGLVGLYQMGILRHLPDPPGPFHSDKVDASGEAYSFLKTPDAAISVASYGATAALIGMGAGNRYRDQPWLPLLLAAKVAVDALGAGVLTAEQVTKHKKVCFYCLVAALATFATVPQVLPEAKAAWQALRDG